ncbi:flagellar export protein FliJ [Shewanella sp. NIFS-20-20]|uniref:flagellar export protein FliJ n=1 Tax=Shewanella sp. NIFS-20-20 TaxID=2853806 RepID=UPI001C488A08|nr:flagellar export protein FliJ [Shewanella sp. NIFS-20-20]MBV7314796.1 flagellar export protein FliJ [Shewanella sp. NIFS-20-20]
MPSKDPLQTVLKLVTEAEQQAALQLKSAQLECQKRQQQLNSLNQYRLDYMQQLKAQQGQDISASYYHQFHRFIRQIDEAITTQVKTVAEADNLRQHRQAHWLQRQQKRKSVEQLLAKKAQQADAKAQRLEQKQLDEFVVNQFARRTVR